MFRSNLKNATATVLVRLLGIIAVGILALLGSTSFAQVDRGAITGVVVDSTGAVIANAEITVTNVDTGLDLKTKSNGTGNFVVSPLKIGNYTVAAAAPGFHTTKQENLHLNAQQRLNVNLTLKPGNVAQTVTVASAPPLLQTQQASVGQTVSTQTIKEAPLLQRSGASFALRMEGKPDGELYESLP